VSTTEGNREKQRGIFLLFTLLPPVPEKEDLMAKHITSEKTYYLIFAALIGMTLLTVALSFVKLGGLHLIVGLAIATTKAVLVALFFMHLLYTSRLSWTMFLSGLFWLGILLSLTLADYLSRNLMSY
jgi:cytochrome c oxidase subunit 4